MARSRLPLLPQHVTIEQGAVGDCYLLAIIDCILNEGEDGRAKLQNLISELPDGSIEIRLPSNELSIEPLLDRRFLGVYYRDAETHHDVFTFSITELDAISSDKAGVTTNALLVKILERIIPCYFHAELGLPESKSDTTWGMKAHSDARRHRGQSSSEFVAKLLGIHASPKLTKEDILLIKTMWPNAPVYIEMDYGRTDVHGRQHGRHALRLQDFSTHELTHMFHLINPWDNHRKIESYSNEELETKRYYAYVLNVSEEKFNLLKYLLKQYKNQLDSDPAQAEKIMSHATYLFGHPLLINSLIGNAYLYHSSRSPEELFLYVESFKETLEHNIEESKKDILATFHLYGEYKQLSRPSYDHWIYRSALEDRANQLLKKFEENFGKTEKDKFLALIMSDVSTKIQNGKKVIEQEHALFVESTINELNNALPVSFIPSHSPNEITQLKLKLMEHLSNLYSSKVSELKERYSFQYELNVLKIHTVYTEIRAQIEGQALIAAIKLAPEYKNFLDHCSQNSMRIFEAVLMQNIFTQKTAFAALVGKEKADRILAPFLKGIQAQSIAGRRQLERKIAAEIQNAIVAIKSTPTFFQSTSNIDSIIKHKENLHSNLNKTIHALREHLEYEVGGNEKTVYHPRIEEAIEETRTLIDQAAQKEIDKLNSPPPSEQSSTKGRRNH